MSFLHPTEKFQLAGKTLVVPVVSTANLSQLAVDVLVSTFSLHRIGLLDSRYLVPVAGGREDGETGVTTPLELYGREDVSVVVIHQRSPALKSKKQEFVESLLEFITTSQFAAVLFCCGVDLTNRSDTQMHTPTYHLYPANGTPLESTPLATSIAQLPIPRYTSPSTQKPTQSPTDESAIPFIPGGGLTRRLLSSLPPSWTTPTAALLQFVLEGDNRADAQLFAAVVAKVLRLEATSWKQPKSWNGLFGAPHDQTLYG